MSDSWCKTCKEFMLFPKSHRCPPIWNVFMKDYHDEEEPARVYAADAEAAAVKWAETYDTDDYPLMSGGEEDVVVWNDENEKKTFTITGEAVPQYYAREKSDAKR